MESKGDSESYNLHSKSNLNSQSKFNFIFAPSHKLSNNLENKLNSINSKVVTIKSYSSYQTATAYDNVRRKPKFKLKLA